MVKFKVLIFLAFHIAFSKEDPTGIKYKTKLIVPNITNKHCKKIKCPRVEVPVCVKLKYRKPEFINKTTYILMINKCEMSYVKCHEGVAANIVPMKYCEHKESISNGHKRSKRQVREAKKNHGVKEFKLKRRRGSKKDTSYSESDTKSNEEPNNSSEISSSSSDTSSTDESDSTESKVKLKNSRLGANQNVTDKDNGINTESEHSSRNNESVGTNSANDNENDGHLEDSENESFNLENYEEYQVQNGEDYNTNSDINDDTHEDENDTLETENNQNTDNVNNYESVESINKFEGTDSANDGKNESEVDNDESQNAVNNESNNEKSGEGNGDQNGDSEEQTADDVNNGSTVAVIQEHDDNDKDNITYNKDVNLEEYEADCPTVCPARDVMVCAKCPHNVYRTFMSVCHVRMFRCKHPEEALELVSRYPCILSAPYLSEESMKPQGKVSEANDEDVVLKFIKCRDEGKIPAIEKLVHENLVWRRTINSNCEFVENIKLPKHKLIIEKY